ncbi:MAG: internalin, partial [Myxococcaceae bacterium]|nr:internalin [Myxococcaceae bacterium]
NTLNRDAAVTTTDLGAADVATVDAGPVEDVAVVVDADADAAAAPDAPAGDAVTADVVAPTDARVACTTNRECAATGRLCDVAAGVCVQCLTGAQCTVAGEVCLAHRCAAGTRCASSRTCMGLVCETTRGVCVDCLADVDCADAGVCRANNCVAPPRACRSSRECTDQVCDAARGVCVDCLTDVDCATGQFCGADNLCRAQACAPNATSCADVTHLRVCDARGTATTDRPCGANEVCAMNRCVPRVCTPGERSCGAATQTRLCNPDGLGYTTATCSGALTCSAGVCTDCVDADGDGVSDAIEGAPSRNSDGDATPDYMDLDSDNDGYSDRVEAARAYPGFVVGSPALTCGAAPDACDGAADGRANYIDLDSDNDGVSDADERARATNPCARDTDGDGATDLVEQIARTDPTAASSRLPATSQVAELPYRPGGVGPVENQEFSFAQRLRPTDVMFVVNSTGSMATALGTIPSAVSAIIDGVTAGLGGASADVRFGVTDYRDFGEGAVGDSGAYAFNVRQRLDANAAFARAAVTRFAAASGGDAAESEVPTMYALLNGLAFPTYGGSFNRAATASDCGGDATAFGWSCFLPGRTPVLVVYSDGAWHNGPGASTNFYGGTPGAPTYNQLVAEFNRRTARFIAVDVTSSGSTREHSAAAARLAADSSNVPSSGSPFVFVGSATATQSQVISAVGTIAGQGRTPITTAVLADASEGRLPAGHVTSEFIRVINPLRGVPDAPAGYDRREGGAFVGVASGTTVTFNAVLANDVVMPGAVDQVFAAYVNLYNSGLYLEQRTFYVLVPAPR